MSDTADNLTTKQARFVAALLTGSSLEEAAAAASVAYMTARRWQRDPAVVAELAAGRRQAIGAALDVLTGASRDAAAAIVAILNDPQLAPSLRLRAAGEVLDRLTKWAELEDLQRRIEALEARIESHT